MKESARERIAARKARRAQQQAKALPPEVDLPMFEPVGPPWWGKRPVVLIGGGSSRAGIDFDQFRDKADVLAIKGSMFDWPWATGFGLDLPRFREWAPRIEREIPDTEVWWSAPIEQMKVRLYLQQRPRNVHFIKRERGPGLSDDLGHIYAGGTSGYGGLGFAVHKLSNRPAGTPALVLLYGYDYGQIDGKWHDRSHHVAQRVQNPSQWRTWAGYYSALIEPLKERYITVLNVSPRSTIDAFEKVDHEQALLRMDRFRP